MEEHLITGLQHIGIPTEDIEKTTEFYGKLGFTVAMDTVNPNSGARVVFLELDNLILETYESKCVKNSGAIDHIALNVTDIYRTREMLEKRGMVPSSEIKELPFWKKGVRFFKLIGISGETVELCEKIH